MRKFGILPILLSCTIQAQEPPDIPTLVLIADGDPAAYSFATTPPSNWFDPDITLSWKTAPAGFGGPDRADEVSTIDYFSSIRLRQHFDLPSTPESLTLSLKQDEADAMVYLNGEVVLELAANQLPSPDSDGFRHYDLGSRIPLLTSAGNLLAVYSKGRILTPVLHATSLDAVNNSMAVNPTQTRLTEGGPPLRIRVFRLSPTSSSTRLFLNPSPAFTATESDFRACLDGVVLPVIRNHNGHYLQIPFSGEEASKVIELETTDDIHAEGEEGIELNSHGSGIRFVIKRNDMVVTRTTVRGEGSLSQAIENAELTPGIEIIRFDDAEGVPFTLAPVTVRLDDGSPGRYGLREGFVIEGPASPGRVTIQAGGGPLFYISGAAGAAETQDLTLRRLVFRGSSLVVESLRYGGTMLIEDCEFVENERVLELYSRENAAIVRRCLFTENTKECVYQGTSGLPPIIENCTFAFNSGTNVESRPVATFESCTFVGDGARFASGRAEFMNCLFSGVTSDLKLTNRDFDQGGNLFAGTLSNASPLSPTHPESLAVGSDSAGLGALDHHGGFTRTISILPTSPARDLGLPAEGQATGYDQRGQPYLRRVGPAPDAGAYELQLANEALVIGITTQAAFDATTGLYFQYAVIHNLSPWTVDGFRIHVEGLPEDATLYNASADGVIDVAGPIPPSAQRIVVLQYSASRPDLLLSPELDLEFDPSSVDPYRTPVHRPEIALHFNGLGDPCLNFRTEPGGDYQIEVSDDAIDWHPKGPVMQSESDHLIWKDPDTMRPSKLFYRVTSSK